MLDDIILTIGKPAFGDALFESLRREVRARQVVLYDFTSDGRVDALAEKDDREDGCVHKLVHDYVERYHVDDPFKAHCAPSAVRRVEHRMFAVDDLAKTDYAQRLFVEPGIAGKLSLIVRRPAGALCLSIYRDRQHGPFATRDLRLLDNVKMPLVAALERHAELMPVGTTRAQPSLDAVAQLLMDGAPTQRLSLREAQICARIVSGYSNEAIGLVLGLSIHSVRTYRRRAYSKLGIASQNELFSLVLNGGVGRGIGASARV